MRDLGGGKDLMKEGGKIIGGEIRKSAGGLRVPRDVGKPAQTLIVTRMTGELNQEGLLRVLQDQEDKIPLTEEDLLIVHLQEFKKNVKEVEIETKDGVMIVPWREGIVMKVLQEEGEILKKEDVMTVHQKDLLHLKIEGKEGEMIVAQKLEKKGEDMTVVQKLKEIEGDMTVVLKKGSVLQDLQGRLLNLLQEGIQGQEILREISRLRIKEERKRNRNLQTLRILIGMRDQEVEVHLLLLSKTPCPDIIGLLPSPKKSLLRGEIHLEAPLLLQLEEIKEIQREQEVENRDLLLRIEAKREEVLLLGREEILIEIEVLLKRKMKARKQGQGLVLFQQSDCTPILLHLLLKWRPGERKREGMKRRSKRKLVVLSPTMRMREEGLLLMRLKQREMLMW